MVMERIILQRRWMGIGTAMFLLRRRARMLPLLPRSVRGVLRLAKLWTLVKVHPS
jgi:hypothetical protein